MGMKTALPDDIDNSTYSIHITNMHTFIYSFSSRPPSLLNNALVQSVQSQLASCTNSDALVL